MYRTRAAFFLGDRWQWVAWNHADPNLHTAVFAKAVELGARGYDTGNADHAELDRYNRQTRG